MMEIVSGWPTVFIKIMTMVIIVIFILDYVASHVLMNMVKMEIDKSDEDNTEEISKKIHDLLKQRTKLTRRIHEAYPNLQARPLWLTNQLKKSQAEFRRIKKATEEEIKKALKSNDKDREKRVAAAKLRQKEAKLKLEKIRRCFIYRKDDI